MEGCIMTARAFFGVLLIAIGGGVLLDRAGLIDFGSLLATWWPLILVAIAAIQIITRSAPLAASLVVLVVGLVFQATTLGLLPQNVWSYLWPLALVAIGLWLMLARGRRPMAMVSTEDQISSFVAFGGVDPRIESGNFQGGSITTLFGGSDVDLRDATLASDGAHLDVTAAFGGVEIIVPQSWQVRVTGLPIFGGWSNKTQKAVGKDTIGPVLEVNCFAAFGGIEVHN
jgi:predicted membrane protein